MGKELLHCFEISETTGKAFIVKRLVIVTFCYRIFRYHWSLTHIFATLTTTVASYPLALYTFRRTHSSSLLFSSNFLLSGHAVAELVEALRYKLESRGFGSRCSHWEFSLT